MRVLQNVTFGSILWDGFSIHISNIYSPREIKCLVSDIFIFIFDINIITSDYCQSKKSQFYCFKKVHVREFELLFIMSTQIR